jgi:3-isopropylmalate/(R)-2-methylmalate dehydratase small subunit
VIELPNAPELINDGDDIEIDYANGVINNKTQNKQIKFMPLPDFALEIIKDGGLLEHIKNKQAK